MAQSTKTTIIKENQKAEAMVLQDIINRLITKEVLSGRPLTLDEIKFLLKKAMYTLREHPNALLEIDPPVVLCGDTHGQFTDVIRIFKLNGFPPTTHICSWVSSYSVSWFGSGMGHFLGKLSFCATRPFSGDYVDRGEHSIEVICTVFALKVVCPREFYFLRGNHETKDINKVYGFFAKCEQRFPGAKLWNDFNNVFDWLPLAALVGERLFCMHGGIPRGLESFDQIRRIPLPTKCPREGIVPDLLWSDPCLIVQGFVPSTRGLGYLFGEDEVESFCNRMKVDLIVRAHQVFQAGYEFFSNQRLVTIFGAPNYVGIFRNDAACLRVEPDMRCIIRI